MSSHPDGGRLGRPCLRDFLSKGAQGTLPCETDQAKPDRISRLARSTNLSKILEGDSPERDPWDRGPDFRPAVLELDAQR